MKNTIAIALLLAGITTTSCADNNRQSAQNLPVSVQPLAFEKTIYERKDGECRGDTTPCITVYAEYPTAIAGVDTARRAINDEITKYVISTLAGHLGDTASPGNTLDSLSAALFREYRDYIQSSSEYGGFVSPWDVTVTGQVVYQSASVVTVAMSTSSYMGGAHPNHWTIHKNFDPLTGNLLALRDIAIDTVQLAALAEKEFRISNNLGVREDLEKAGFWFGDNTFMLPDNYAFTDNGFLFWYNPYEIASYAQGPIEILLPYARLKGLLKAEYLP